MVTRSWLREPQFPAPGKPGASWNMRSHTRQISSRRRTSAMARRITLFGGHAIRRATIGLRSPAIPLRSKLMLDEPVVSRSDQRLREPCEHREVGVKLYARDVAYS